MPLYRPKPIPSSQITPPLVFKNRRRLLQQLVGLGASGAVAQAQAASWPLNPAEAQAFEGSVKSGVTPKALATSYNNFYELGLAKTDPAENAHLMQVADPWSVTVSGACEKPGSYHLEDLLKPQALEERVYRLRCVEAWSMVIPWLGVPLGPMLARFKPLSKAKYVQFFTLLDPKNLPGQRRPVLDWPYREGLRLDEAMNPLSFMAVGAYGEPLLNQMGAPFRLVVPWKYGFKSIKSIVEIRFTEQEPATSWSASAPKEYGFYANVNPAVSHPRWSQAKERRIDADSSGFSAIFQSKIPTELFNGYGDEVASLYQGMDLSRYY